MYQEAGILALDTTVEEMVQKLAKIPLRQQPGSEWHYSVSVDVQGYLVEKFTGMPFFISLDVLQWLQSMNLGAGGSVMFQFLALFVTICQKQRIIPTIETVNPHPAHQRQ